MAIDKTGIWSLGESNLWYTPTSGLDASWGLGESFILDEYVVVGVVQNPYQPWMQLSPILAQ